MESILFTLLSSTASTSSRCLQGTSQSGTQMETTDFASISHRNPIIGRIARPLGGLLIIQPKLSLVSTLRDGTLQHQVQAAMLDVSIPVMMKNTSPT